MLPNDASNPAEIAAWFDQDTHQHHRKYSRAAIGAIRSRILLFNNPQLCGRRWNMGNPLRTLMKVPWMSDRVHQS
ncbi:hypothetical protein MTO96_003955 [Rhipicephalus appendiculatus]